MVKNKDMQFFYGEFENEKKKGQNFFDLPERGFEPQIDHIYARKLKFLDFNIVTI